MLSIKKCLLTVLACTILALGASPAVATKGEKSKQTNDCTTICKKARDMSKVGCVEGQFEELGFEMDSDPCNQWEGVAATGAGGDPCTSFNACKAKEGFSESHCSKVKAACF